jgi:hypothetical protein
VERYLPGGGWGPVEQEVEAARVARVA